MAGYFQEIYLREATVIYIRALCDAQKMCSSSCMAAAVTSSLNELVTANMM